jgi:thiol:disulfide interchange protein
MLALLVCSSLFAAPATAEDDITKLVTPTLVPDTTAIVPGKPFRMGVLLKMMPGWHTYYKVSGEAGVPTKVEWTLPPGYKASELMWQKPHKFIDATITTYGYQDQTLVAATITPPKNAATGSSVAIKANVKWLACQDSCVPGKREISTTLKVAKTATVANAALFAGVGWNGSVSELEVDKHAELPASNGAAVAATTAPANTTATTATATGTGTPTATEVASAHAGFSGSILDADLKVADNGDQKLSLLAALGFAFIGGFILNFMPCVLPVISIKVLSFMQQAGDDPKRIFKLGMAFTAGIVSSFIALAIGVIAVQQAGQKIGWGFQFQYPIFLFAMAAVVLMFALSLFGLFYVQVRTGQDKIDELASQEGYTGTFFKGVLATTLSTPCSAPMLGSAVGFAFSAPPYVVLLMFTTIALGMAFPYILLTARPSWMKFLPRPGIWMEKFKESMGFLLLATVVWLLWVLTRSVGPDAGFAAVAFLVALSFAVWMVGRFTDLTSTTTRRAVVYSLAGIVVVAAYGTMLRPFPDLLAFSTPSYKMETAQTPYSVASNVTQSIDWQPFTVDKLNAELAAGKTVFVDFTADWCLTCKTNEAGALSSKAVIDKLSSMHAVTLRADWTHQDATIASLLRKFGRSGVPLYVVFPAGRPTQPIVLPEGILTTDQVLDALNRG